MGLRRVLAPTFQAGEMPLFIPWRRRAPRRPTIDRSAESDPLAPPAGRFLFSVIRFGATLELGRWSYGVETKARPHPQDHNGSTSCSRSDISGWRDAALYPLAAPRAAPTNHNRKQGDCYPIDLA